MNKPNLSTYKNLPNHTGLESKDVLAVFGLDKSKYTITKLIKLGLIPAPTGRIKRSNGKTAKLSWSLGSLRDVFNYLTKQSGD